MTKFGVIHNNNIIMIMILIIKNNIVLDYYLTFEVHVDDNLSLGTLLLKRKGGSSFL